MDVCRSERSCGGGGKEKCERDIKLWLKLSCVCERVMGVVGMGRGM